MIQVNPEDLYVHHHLGLGDHLICNGMVRLFLQDIPMNKMYMVVKNGNYETVRRMYSDEPRIEFIKVGGDSEFYSTPYDFEKMRLSRIGFEKSTNFEFDVSFYNQFNIPFSCRWDYFKVNRDLDKEKELESRLGLSDEPFILIHNRCSMKEYDLVLPNIKRVYVQPLTDCLLDWCRIAEKAEEVHCIDSSFVHLAQCLNVKKGIFHNPRGMNCPFRLREGWDTVDYSNKEKVNT